MSKPMDSQIPYSAPPHLYLFKMTARSLKVGDIIKTRWGMRQVLEMSTEEDDVWLKFYDEKFVLGAYATVEVLVV